MACLTRGRRRRGVRGVQRRVVGDAALVRGDVADYTTGSRLIRVLVVSAAAYTRSFPVIVMIHNRADGDVPGILLPLPADLAGGGTIDLSRIRFADPSAFG